MAKLKKIILTAILTAGFMFPAGVQAAEFLIDPFNSTLAFTIQHLQGFHIGAFTRFGGVIEVDENNRITGIVADVDMSSIYSRDKSRDQWLLGEKLFHAQKFTKATFRGKKINGNTIFGELNLKGKKKEIVLEYRVSKVIKDKQGQSRIGLSAKGKFNRNDFGVSYNEKLNKGQNLLGDDVQLIIEVEGILKEDLAKHE